MSQKDNVKNNVKTLNTMLAELVRTHPMMEHIKSDESFVGDAYKFNDGKMVFSRHVFRAGYQPRVGQESLKYIVNDFVQNHVCKGGFPKWLVTLGQPLAIVQCDDDVAYDGDGNVMVVGYWSTDKDAVLV